MESPAVPPVVERATLTFDSADTLVAGARTAVMTDARRQYLWTSSTMDVALTMWQEPYSDRAICIDGQLLPHADRSARASVGLLIEGVRVAETMSDFEGCFNFEGLDEGDYEFRCELTDRIVVAGPIPVAS